MSNVKSETAPEQEEWRTIPGLIYSGFYEASSLGRIKATVSGEITYGVRRQYYTIWLPCAKRNFMVHRLIALAFLGECPKDIVVNHIDLNKHNNRISNLEYVTQSRNAKHASDHYRNQTPEAMVHIVKKMMRLRAAGWSYEDIGYQFSMKKNQVRAIIMASGLQTEDDRCDYIELKNPLTKYLFYGDDE